jgi:DMSO reductase anchor subunit
VRPTFSIIFFTVLSGTGYGLLFQIGIGLLVLWPYHTAPYKDGATLMTLYTYPSVINYGLLIGTLLVSAGLFASLAHLGQPQRAWRALSQWRSSWLSREGVAALISYVPLLSLIIVFWLPWFSPALGTDFFFASVGTLARPLGGVLAVCAMLTVYCTSGIYTSLKTIHAWHNAYVLPSYLLFSLLGGVTVFWMLHALTGNRSDLMLHVAPFLTICLALICVVLKLAYWRFIDMTQHPATTESATGLGRFGAVRSVEAPHTEENYLTREMGFALARKHAARVRNIAVALFGGAPIVAAIAALLWPVAAAACSCLCVCAAIAGIFVERWLFFAEAKHVVMLYYDNSTSAV